MIVTVFASSSNLIFAAPSVIFRSLSVLNNPSFAGEKNVVFKVSSLNVSEKIPVKAVSDTTPISRVPSLIASFVLVVFNLKFPVSAVALSLLLLVPLLLLPPHAAKVNVSPATVTKPSNAFFFIPFSPSYYPNR